MKRGAIGCAISAVALGLPGLASAQAPAVLEGLPCVEGRIGHDDIIAALLADAKVSIQGDVLSAFASGRLGDQTVARRNGADETLSLPAWDLTDATRRLLGVGDHTQASMVVIAPNAPADIDRLFLNRAAGGLVEVRCGASAQRAAGGTTWRDALVITSTGDAGATTALADRPFATFSYLDNRESGDQTGSADIYIGFSRRIWLDGAIGPSLSYQRMTGSDPQNDLTFALEGGGGRFTWSAGYETDDQFESAAYRARFSFEPFVGPNICARSWGAADAGGVPTRGGRCDLEIVGDYVDVSDIGSKATLATRREFARFGVRLSSSWWVRAGEDAYWRISGSYDQMETVSGDDGDAALGKVSIDYLPSEQSLYSLGISYERGEDITSFTPIDQVKFTVGIRR